MRIMRYFPKNRSSYLAIIRCEVVIWADDHVVVVDEVCAEAVCERPGGYIVVKIILICSLFPTCVESHRWWDNLQGRHTVRCSAGSASTQQTWSLWWCRSWRQWWQCILEEEATWMSCRPWWCAWRRHWRCCRPDRPHSHSCWCCQRKIHSLYQATSQWLSEQLTNMLDMVFSLLTCGKLRSAQLARCGWGRRRCADGCSRSPCWWCSPSGSGQSWSLPALRWPCSAGPGRSATPSTRWSTRRRGGGGRRPACPSGRARGTSSLSSGTSVLTQSPADVGISYHRKKRPHNTLQRNSSCLDFGLSSGKDKPGWKRWEIHRQAVPVQRHTHPPPASSPPALSLVGWTQDWQGGIPKQGSIRLHLSAS